MGEYTITGSSTTAYASTTQKTTSLSISKKETFSLSTEGKLSITSFKLHSVKSTDGATIGSSSPTILTSSATSARKTTQLKSTSTLTTLRQTKSADKTVRSSSPKQLKAK